MDGMSVFPFHELTVITKMHFDDQRQLAVEVPQDFGLVI